jgi:hypothetical protein
MDAAGLRDSGEASTLFPRGQGNILKPGIGEEGERGNVR